MQSLFSNIYTKCEFFWQINDVLAESYLYLALMKGKKNICLACKKGCNKVTSTVGRVSFEAYKEQRKLPQVDVIYQNAAFGGTPAKLVLLGHTTLLNNYCTQ